MPERDAKWLRAEATSSLDLAKLHAAALTLQTTIRSFADTIYSESPAALPSQDEYGMRELERWIEVLDELLLVGEFENVDPDYSMAPRLAARRLVQNCNDLELNLRRYMEIVTSPDALRDGLSTEDQSRLENLRSLIADDNKNTRQAITKWIRQLTFAIPADNYILKAKYNELVARAALNEVQSSVERVRKTEQQVSEAAGTVATGSLAIEFQNYGILQIAAARRWMVLSGVTLAAVALVGVLLLNAGTPAWQQTVAHLVIALPAGGVAAYGARESSRHRESAQWANRVAAQLKAIGPYTERLAAGDRAALWNAFGTYIFGPYAVSPASDNQLHTIPPELLKVLTDVAKLSR